MKARAELERSGIAMTRHQESTLKPHERSAMFEFKRIITKGYSIGQRRIVAMQGLERAGLVKRVTHMGVIADWQLTPEGEAWNG